MRRNQDLRRPEDRAQRFLIVPQPGDEVHPHRHCRQELGAGCECVLVLQGAIGRQRLDGSGAVTGIGRLEGAGPLRGVERAEGCRHTLVAWEPDTVIFACKQGPDRPLEDKDFQPVFPLEGRWRPGSWSWSGDSCWMETFCA